MSRILVLLLCIASSTAAKCPPWRGASIAIGPSGERLCAKHHDVLQRATVYGPNPTICLLVQPTRRAAAARACCPNALPFGISRTKSQLYSRALETVYCNQCETFLQAQVSKKT